MKSFKSMTYTFAVAVMMTSAIVHSSFAATAVAAEPTSAQTETTTLGKIIGDSAFNNTLATLTIVPKSASPSAQSFIHDDEEEENTADEAKCPEGVDDTCGGKKMTPDECGKKIKALCPGVDGKAACGTFETSLGTAILSLPAVTCPKKKGQVSAEQATSVMY